MIRLPLASQQECSVCWQPICDFSEICLFSCRHWLCRECAEAWVLRKRNDSCPLCRSPLWRRNKPRCSAITRMLTSCGHVFIYVCPCLALASAFLALLCLCTFTGYTWEVSFVEIPPPANVRALETRVHSASSIVDEQSWISVLRSVWILLLFVKGFVVLRFLYHLQIRHPLLLPL